MHDMPKVREGFNFDLAKVSNITVVKATFDLSRVRKMTKIFAQSY